MFQAVASQCGVPTVLGEHQTQAGAEAVMLLHLWRLQGDGWVAGGNRAAGYWCTHETAPSIFLEVNEVERQHTAVETLIACVERLCLSPVSS